MTTASIVLALLFVLFLISAIASTIIGIAAKEHRTSDFWFRLAVLSALLAIAFSSFLR